jgi:spoIIIJ-associated protein
MRSYEFSGKTIEKAIKQGLEELGKSQEEVDIKIISEGGLFKKAKIVINIEEEPVLTNFAKPKAEAKPVDDFTWENSNAPINETIDKPKTEVSKEQPLPAKKQKDIETKQEDAKIVAKASEPVAEEIETPKTEEVRKVEHILGTTPNRYVEPENKRCENNTTSVKFVEELLSNMQVTAKVTLKETKDNSSVIIETEDAGDVIGYRGECLNAIQYLANVVEQRKNANAKRVVIDAGGYKERREQSLRAMAIKIAGKVEATGKPYKFDPMNAFERRIIHTELQNYSSVETHSEGVEPHRRLVVTRKSK